MTKGQRAMAVAMIWPEAKPGQRTDLIMACRNLYQTVEVSPQYVSYARTAQKFSRRPRHRPSGAISYSRSCEKTGLGGIHFRSSGKTRTGP